MYLELWLPNLFNGQRTEDHLQRAGNRTANVRTMRRLFPFGRLLPWLSLAMIVVARKRAWTIVAVSGASWHGYTAGRHATGPGFEPAARRPRGDPSRSQAG